MFPATAWLGEYVLRLNGEQVCMQVTEEEMETHWEQLVGRWGTAKCEATGNLGNSCGEDKIEDGALHETWQINHNIKTVVVIVIIWVIHFP